MKLMALDVGTKRIGVAKADSNVRIAVPYNAIEVDGEEFTKIASLVRAWSIDGLVLGLPRNNSGEETAQTKYVREFAAKLKKAVPGLKICFQDESLTSVEAEKRLSGRKNGFKKGDIDSEAATIILQDFLEEHTGKKATVRAAAAPSRASVQARKPHRFTVAIVLCVILLVLCGGLGTFYYVHNLSAVTTGVNCETDIAVECEETAFRVNQGAGVGEVARALQDQGLIRDALVFQVYFRLNFGGETVKPGEYMLNSTMTPREIIEIIISGDNSHVFSFTVLPGETVADVKKHLLEVGYSEEEASAALAKDYSSEEFGWVFAGKPSDASLEGYLFGETYEFYREDSAETVIARLIEGLAKVVSENDLEAKFATQGLNLYQGITLASIVQKEAGNPTDAAKVAQVFYNRLELNMTLGSDVTASYAADLLYPNRGDSMSNDQVLAVDSPYNTRKYTGLTPGPISNPSAATLIATATPDNSATNYLYFLTGDDGLMYYSTTDEGHQRNIQNHCQTLCNAAL